MQKNKIDAIYALREAAEEKALAEVELSAHATKSARDVLLNAQLQLEAKTQDAIEACHECGHAHASDDAHVGSNGNVIQVAFGKDSGRMNEIETLD